MRMPRFVFGVGCLLLCLPALPAAAEEAFEAWRSPFGEPRCVAVNPSDNSCWMADGRWVRHLAADGSELTSLAGFAMPQALSVNPTDGSCWVADGGEVIKLGADGAELWRRGGFEFWEWSNSCLSVNRADGSCWVADYEAGEVIHLGADGTELLRVGYLYRPVSVSVNPADGSCWVAALGSWSYVDMPTPPRRVSARG